MIFLESNEAGIEQYFGERPKMIFWREFRGVIVALIGDCEDCNLANQSVFITFILMEVQRMREEETDQRRRWPEDRVQGGSIA